MPIYDLTYRGYAGGRSRLPKFFPLLENTITLAFRNKLLVTCYRVTAVPVLIAIIFLYVRYQVENLAGRRVELGGEFSFEIPSYFRFLSAQGVIAMVVAAIVGSAAIAGDRRGNALEALFSRPITRFDYLFGRWLGVFTLVMGATLIPGVLIWYFDNAFAIDPDHFRKTLDYPWRIAVWSIVHSASVSLLILAFSALIGRTWIAFAGFAGFVFIGSGLMGGLSAALRRDFDQASEFLLGFGYLPALFRIEHAILGVGSKMNLRTSLNSSILTVAVLAILSILVLRKRVRPIEVVS